MKTLKKIIYAMPGLLLFFTSCSKDDDDIIVTQSNVVIVGHNIFSPETWHSDSVYIIPSTVKIDASLTIQAGTIIKFYSGEGLEVWENGTINAIGGKDSYILFTSIKDDIGGDNNKDLLATTPSPGDWGSITLGEQNNSHFSHCIFSYGGGDNNTGVLDLGENYSEIENCKFV